MCALTASQMKYLHAVYKARKGDSPLRSVDVARALGVTKASVCRMIKLLVGMGLLSTQKSGFIEMTEQGRATGRMLHQKVTRILPFFAEHLELDEPKATDSAYLFLASFSGDCVDRLLDKGWTAQKRARTEPARAAAGE